VLCMITKEIFKLTGVRFSVEQFRIWLQITLQHESRVQRPIKYKESHIFAVFVLVLTTLCMLGLEIFSVLFYARKIMGKRSSRHLSGDCHRITFRL